MQHMRLAREAFGQIASEAQQPLLVAPWPLLQMLRCSRTLWELVGAYSRSNIHWRVQEGLAKGLFHFSQCGRTLAFFGRNFEIKFKVDLLPFQMTFPSFATVRS
jgi:hypothetical protein